MPDGPALSKHAVFGFGIQTAQGVPQTGTVVWCPFVDTLTFGPAGENELYRQSDYTDWVHEVVANGKWHAGDVPITLRPDSTFLDAFATALLTRDATYNQQSFLTCYIAETVGGVAVVKGVQDCKITSATFTLEKGRPVGLSCSIVGLDSIADDSAAVALGAGFGPPYLWKSSIIRASFAGGSYLTCVNLERATLNVNNNVEDPAEGHRLGAGLVPARLWNNGAFEVDGSVSRDFVNYRWYDVYYSHLENGPDTSSLGLRFIFSGTSTLTMTIPRISLRSWPRSITGSNVGRQMEEMAFDALGSRDGSVAPLVAVVS